MSERIIAFSQQSNTFQYDLEESQRRVNELETALEIATTYLDSANGAASIQRVQQQRLLNETVASFEQSEYQRSEQINALEQQLQDANIRSVSTANANVTAHHNLEDLLKDKEIEMAHLQIVKITLMIIILVIFLVCIMVMVVSYRSYRKAKIDRRENMQHYVQKYDVSKSDGMSQDRRLDSEPEMKDEERSCHKIVNRRWEPETFSDLLDNSQMVQKVIVEDIINDIETSGGGELDLEEEDEPQSNVVDIIEEEEEEKEFVVSEEFSDSLLSSEMVQKMIADDILYVTHFSKGAEVNDAAV